MVEKVAIKANIFCLFFLAAASLAWAHIADFDEHWQKREEHAKRVALESYHPNPEEVTTHLNHHVHLAVEHDIANNTNARRGLRGRRKVAGPCEATNPIDQCWRCRPNWADERKRLAQCVLGFGRNTTGGLEGNFYVVTDSSDNDMVNPKPGTLRHAVIQTEPLWIIFASDMSIRLSQELMITSNKTIDARGAIVHITTGAGITIQYAQNVIIHGLRIHDIHQGTGGEIRDSVHHKGHRTMSDGDGISIFGSSNVWLDHISLSRCRDGLIDVIQGSTAITISNTHMTEHNDVLLFGAHDKYSEDKLMQITVAFNHFGKGLTQRIPRCRHGYFHVVNNDYTHWLMYAIGGSANPTIISEGNRFIAPNVQNAKEVTHRDVKKFPEWVNWKWTSTGDVFQNGAFFVPSGAPEVDTHSSQDKISFKTGEFASRLTRYAGSLKCRVGKPC